MAFTSFSISKDLINQLRSSRQAADVPDTKKPSGWFEFIAKAFNSLVSERSGYRAPLEPNCKPQQTVRSNVSRHTGARRNRFAETIERLHDSPYFQHEITQQAPYGYFRARPIIADNTAIQGGIFVGVAAHEAIVVDAKYGALQPVLSTLLGRCQTFSPDDSGYEYDIFTEATELTRETLHFSEEGVANLAISCALKLDEKVSLDLFIAKRIGVSRHQVLLAGYLLEKLCAKGILPGTVSLDYSISDDAAQERLIYVAKNGDIFRFDPTKGMGKNALH